MWPATVYSRASVCHLMTTELLRLTQSLTGRYAIEHELGRGGMATVYLARDLKHDRRVAVKVLHPDLAAALGAERFLAEIRTTANLQHPHILPLHDSGEADGLLFYVMPFVEGETLRARLEREQQLPIDDAVRISREVLSALDYAHRHGVVHRDVKPENVLLHDGSALVADFGIALAVQSASGPRMTQTGLSLGTPSYMSPEQAMGEKHIDGRTDIYAAGAMLYEMLSGEPPFIGATVQAIVAKVITERPTPLSTVRDTVPAGVGAAVLKALAKLPADRFATAAQFAEALVRGATDAPPSASSTRERAQASRRVKGVVGVLGALVLALAVTSALLWRAASRVVPERVAFEFSPERAYVAGGGLALSPDGRRLALIMWDTSAVHHRVVAIRELGSTAIEIIPATAGAAVVGWTADGRDVLFGDQKSISRISLGEGGVPRKVTLDSVSGTFGDLSANADGQVVFSDAGRMAVVPVVGGKVRHIYPDSLKLPPQVLPRFFGDGKHFVFSTGYGSTVHATWVGSLDGERPHQILPQSSRAVPLNGELYFVKDGALVMQPFDERKGEMRGEPVFVARVGADAITGDAPFDVSPGGTIVYAHTISGRTRVFAWYDRAGKQDSVAGAPTESAEMNLSPDGRSVAFDLFVGAGPDIWTMSTQTGIRTRVTSDAASNSPVWMPNSQEVIYQRRVGLGLQLRRRVLGTAIDTALTDPAGPNLNVDDVSPDGSTVLARSPGQLNLVSAASGALTPVLKRPNITETRFSPDGRWVTFGSTETNSYEIYAASYPKFDRVVRVSSAGGVQARWRKDGRELLYLTLDGKVMSAAVSTTGINPFAAPIELFRSPFSATSPGNDTWSVSNDGKRFLFSRPLVGARRRHRR